MQNIPDLIAGKLIVLATAFKKRKLVFIAATIILLALASFFVFGGAKKASGDFLTDTVKRNTITSTIAATGTVEPVSTISVSFKNSEIIKKIYVKVGDHVTAGQLLADQDSANLEAEVNQASASLKGAVSKLTLLQNGSREEDIEQAKTNVTIAQSNYDLAKANLERYQKLYQEGAISQADLDKTNTDYINSEGKLRQAQESLKSLQSGSRAEDIAAAAAQVESNKAQLQISQNDLTGVRMVSPIDGIVSAINGAEGQRSTANNNNTSGGGLIVIISEDLQVKAQVNEADIGRTEVGQAVEFTVNSFPSKTFTGKVSAISPQANTVSNVQLYDVIIQLDKDQGGLKAGMPANVNIIVNRRENVLTIPKGAVTYAANNLSKLKQTASSTPDGSENSNNNRQTGRRNSNAGTSGENKNSPPENAETAKVNNQEQQATIIVLDGSGKPVPRRIATGLSDLRNLEVIRGLNEGETVVIGALNQPAAATSGQNRQGNQTQSGNTPFMPRIGGGGNR
ncbi:MAG: Macrolide export protein MacA [Pelotomaculum sp. PtaU1.Bin035]|nr:MAG: Macrolide export protein MacA [Pelotomaculum sp. PtaU1.Bin035]